VRKIRSLVSIESTPYIPLSLRLLTIIAVFGTDTYFGGTSYRNEENEMYVMCLAAKVVLENGRTFLQILERIEPVEIRLVDVDKKQLEQRKNTRFKLELSS
jgi:hypothetical protein